MRDAAGKDLPELSLDVKRQLASGVLSYDEGIKVIANARGIHYKTPPFPPGDEREILRLNLLQSLQATTATKLDRASPAAIARAMAAWNEGHPRQTVTILPWRRSLTIGRTTLKWRGLPPNLRTAASVNAWFRRGVDLGRLIRAVRFGSSKFQTDALAHILLNYQDDLVAPKNFPTTARAIRARFPTRWKTTSSLRTCARRIKKQLDASAVRR